MYKHAQTHLHTQHMYMHTHTHAHNQHACSCTHTNLQIKTCVYTCMHCCVHTDTHMHTCSHTHIFENKPSLGQRLFLDNFFVLMLGFKNSFKISFPTL